MARVQWWKAEVTIVMLWKEIRQGNCLNATHVVLHSNKNVFWLLTKGIYFHPSFPPLFFKNARYRLLSKIYSQNILPGKPRWLSSLETTGIFHHPQIRIHKYFLSDLPSAVQDKCSPCWKWDRYTLGSPGGSLRPTASSSNMSKIP